MARFARLVVPGYPHHVTQRGVRSVDIFTNDEDRLAYLDFMKEEAQRFGITFMAWCLMTNHVHLVAIPEAEDSLARGIGEAHRRYTRLKNFSEGVRGYLFQGRFGSCVLDQRHLLAAGRYVERNPIDAGMVQRATDYR
jgi:REP-associated tyrosine transposase